MEKRINEMKINKIENIDEKLKIDITFNLVHKKTFKILDRVLTQDKINIQYDSDKDNFPKVKIMTLKGPTIEGFNLKRKHLDEIKNLLINSKKDALIQLKNKL